MTDKLNNPFADNTALDDKQKELVVNFVANDEPFTAVKMALRPYLNIEPYLQGSTSLKDSNEKTGENTKAIFTAATILQEAFIKVEDNYQPEVEADEEVSNEAV